MSQTTQRSRQHRRVDRCRPRPHPARCAAPYRRRRLTVAAALFAFIISVGGWFGALSGSSGESAVAAADPAARRTVIAQPGDTLWDIAAEFRGEMSMMNFVDLLVELNDGASLAVGQTVVLP